MSNLRNGHRDRVLKRQHRQRCRAANLPCALCGDVIDYALPHTSPQAFQSDHRIPVSVRPDMAYMPSNLQPAHASCNKSRGTSPLESMSVSGQWVRADW